MRWKTLAVCSTLAVCIGVGVWWLWAQQREYTSGAANLLHIYSDEQNTDPNVQGSTNGVQPNPPSPSPHQESEKPAPSTTTHGQNGQSGQSGQNGAQISQQTANTSDVHAHTSASNSTPAPSTTVETTPSDSTNTSETTPSTTPEAIFSIIGSEGGIRTPLAEGDTVYTITQKMMENYPLPDFDYGKDGRWQYSINGESENTPVEERVLQPGDLLEWHPVLPPPQESTSNASPSTSLPAETSTESSSTPSTNEDTSTSPSNPSV